MLKWGIEKWIKRSSASEHNGETAFTLSAETTTKDEINCFQALNIRHHRAVISEQGDRVNIRSLQLGAWREILGCSSRRENPGEAQRSPTVEEKQMGVEKPGLLYFTEKITRNKRVTQRENSGDLQSPGVLGWAPISTCPCGNYLRPRKHPPKRSRENKLQNLHKAENILKQWHL